MGSCIVLYTSKRANVNAKTKHWREDGPWNMNNQLLLLVNINLGRPARNTVIKLATSKQTDCFKPLPTKIKGYAFGRHLQLVIQSFPKSSDFSGLQ